MRRRITLLWSSPLKVLKRNNEISIVIPSRIGTRGKALERLVPDNFHALHSAPSNVFLLEAVLNPAAQFARGVILPARDGAKLQPQRCSGRPERFHSQRPRPIHQDWRPGRIGPKFGAHAFQRRERRIGRCLLRNGNVHEHLAPVAAEV